VKTERLKQIEEIYHAAVEIPDSERESFFKASCGADVELPREVKSLLTFEKTPTNFYVFQINRNERNI
jgi:hypothetical protein